MHLCQDTCERIEDPPGPQGHQPPVPESLTTGLQATRMTPTRADPFRTGALLSVWVSLLEISGGVLLAHSVPACRPSPSDCASTPPAASNHSGGHGCVKAANSRTRAIPEDADKPPGETYAWRSRSTIMRTVCGTPDRLHVT
ncbi:unnamed protein product [Pleuronectes platessa]|uniref:Uncharacterized protein n=1 Tax=Pleuronectes platessa TaxID=8262 RepID=A0A9N7VXC4_PLEPL|nr:unnamed protein product [Pleuronectes platessa]